LSRTQNDTVSMNGW